MHNTVTVMGNLIENPELTKTRNDNYVAKMRVACSRRVQRPVDNASASQAQQNLSNAGYNADNAGTSAQAVEWVDTDHFFIDVECWGQLAKNVRKSLVKGRPIMANGYMYTSSWEDKDGNKRSRPVLRATNVGLELSWFIAGSKRSSADDDVLLDGVEIPEGDTEIDKNLDDVAPPSDTAADAAAAGESSGFDAAAEAAAEPANEEKKSKVKTTTSKQVVKEPGAPF